MSGGTRIRAHAWQIVGVAGMVLVVSALAVLASCGGGGTANAPTPTVAATPSATPNHDEADVKAAVETLVAAWLKSAKTGSDTQLDQLTIADSTGASNLSTAADIARTTRQTVVVGTYTLSSWQITVSGDEALVSVSLNGTAESASWPALKPNGPSHALSTEHLALTMRRENERWLTVDFSA